MSQSKHHLKQLKQQPKHPSKQIQINKTQTNTTAINKYNKQITTNKTPITTYPPKLKSKQPKHKPQLNTQNH